MITLADVFEALAGIQLEKGNLKFSGVTFHSQKVRPNSLFIALPSEHKDGHTYVGDAFHRGAKVAIVQRDLSDLFLTIDLRDGQKTPSFKLPKVPFCLRVDDTLEALECLAGFWRHKLNPIVVAVGGCTEESVVQQMVAELLSQRYQTTEYSLKPENTVDLCLGLLNLNSNDQSILIEFPDNASVDMPHWMESFCPQVGLISHDPRSTRCDWGNFIKLLPPPPYGTAILDYDRPEERQIAAEIGAKQIFYGLNPQSDLWADEIEGDGQEGIKFRIHYRYESLSLRAPLIGRYSVHTALQVAAVGLALGLSWHDIASGLRNSGSELRLITTWTASGAQILDDTYSSSAESTLAVLNLFEKMEGHKIAVLAEVPEPGPFGENQLMVGVRAAEIVQELVVVGEKAKMLVKAARGAGMRAKAITSVRSAQEAVDLLNGRLEKNDIVLVKGSQEINMEQIVSALEGIQA